MRIMLYCNIMRKFLLFFILLTLSVWIKAATITDPVVDLGTLTFSTSTPGAWSFTATNHSTGAISKQSGTDAIWTGASYTPFNATNLKNYVQARFVYVKVDGKNPPTYSSDCGEISITGLSVYYNNTNFELKRQLSKTKTNPGSLLSPFNAGFYLAFNATVTPVAGKGTCTLTYPLSGWFKYTESSASWDDVPDADFIPVNLTFSITLITEGNSFTHDKNATLNFGTFCKASQTQNLTIRPNGTVAASSTVCPASADISADSFTFKSSQASSFSVAVPSTPVTLTNPITGSTLQVTNFQPSCTSSCTVLNNTATVTVGGTLTVPGGADIGDYTGSYPVSVIY